MAIQSTNVWNGGCLKLSIYNEHVGEKSEDLVNYTNFWSEPFELMYIKEWSNQIRLNWCSSVVSTLLSTAETHNDEEQYILTISYMYEAMSNI